MEKLGCITFVVLDGEPPMDQALDALPDPAAVAELVRTAFQPFLIENGKFSALDGTVALEPPASGWHLIYAYGHAWLTQAGPQVSVRSDTASVLEGAPNLLRRLVAKAAADRTILVLDCCHAEAFDPFIVPPYSPHLVIYACGAEEKAITLTGERASRLSLAIARKLSEHSRTVDLVGVVAAVADHLDGDGVLRGQSVRYRLNGFGVRLNRSRTSTERRRERTVAIVRNVLLASGAVAAAILIALGWFYWSHVLVDLNLADLGGIANEVRIIASEEDPERNVSRMFEEQRVTGNRVRLWVPASNVLLRIQAQYRDGAERGLAFHLDLKPSLDPTIKSLSLTLPPAAEIQTHPHMAYVPSTAWFHGREREPRTNTRPFWIELRPPTVAEYMPLAKGLLERGQLDRENSFILTAQQRSTAVDSTGLEQLRSLNKDLGAIFGAIDAATSPRVSAPSDIVIGLGKLPCESCPAPMTRHEAELYCTSRSMRLPTDLEWELAVRGVDGRVYPWGNQFDETRANVPGLPDKDEPSPDLKPVNAYADQRSPFGLIDTVGNAGDWVINETGSYERVYMGATYRYNQEDATVFRLLPVTDSDYLVREITARCVADPSPPN